jgi:hypothetical protein
MKQLARKSSHISLVPPPEQESDCPAVSPFLDEFFDEWLTSVSPTLVTSEEMKPESSKVAFGKRPLTSTDVTRVHRATVRESTDHRHWPPAVVKTFLVANVIKRNGGSKW